MRVICSGDTFNLVTESDHNIFGKWTRGIIQIRIPWKHEIQLKEIETRLIQSYNYKIKIFEDLDSEYMRRLFMKKESHALS